MSYETIPKVYRGVSYATAGRVLARIAGTEAVLVWRPGGSVYISRMGQSHAYAETSLAIHRGADRNGIPTELHRGGRLSKRLLESKRAEIDRVFGLGTTTAVIEQLRSKTTVLV